MMPVLEEGHACSVTPRSQPDRSMGLKRFVDWIEDSPLGIIEFDEEEFPSVAF